MDNDNNYIAFLLLVYGVFMSAIGAYAHHRALLWWQRRQLQKQMAIGHATYLRTLPGTYPPPNNTQETLKNIQITSFSVTAADEDN